MRPEWTGFEVFAAILRDLAAADEDSERYDRGMLSAFRGFDRVLGRAFLEARVEERRERGGGYARLDTAMLETARRLGAHVPPPRAVRVVGKLDMIRKSTQTFTLQLDAGEEVRGLLIEGDIGNLTPLFGGRVTVHGRAVYRTSGRLLRLDAEAVFPGDKESAIWSKVPPPLERAVRTRDLRRPQTATTGINAFFGSWPGDETDEELLAALEALR